MPVRRQRKSGRAPSCHRAAPERRGAMRKRRRHKATTRQADAADNQREGRRFGNGEK
ncbi:MAG: hypothetical protein R6U56_00060 [Opitutales bacterium]